MRNLTYPEVSLSLTIVAIVTGFAYVAWLEPLLTQLRSDRRATRTLLFELATGTPQAAREPPSAAAATRPAQAFPPQINAPSAPLRRPPRHGDPKRLPNHELELGTSNDPLDGLDEAR